MVQAGFKAGLIGGVIAVVLTLIGLIPCLSGLTACFGTWILWIGVGAWSVSLGGEEIRTAGEGAGAGAVAGAVTAVIGGAVNIAIGLVRPAIFGATAGPSALSQMPPEAWRALQELGIVIAIVLGGLGGLLWKTMKAS